MLLALCALASLPRGTLFAASTEEYISRGPWVPATDCQPKCATNTTCCRDPATSGGLCMATDHCSKVQDTNVSLALKLLRFDLPTGTVSNSTGISMAPYSGATLPSVALPNGDLLMNAVFTINGGTTEQSYL